MSVQVSYKKQFVVFFLLTIVLFVVVEGIARIIETSDLPCGFINSPVFSDSDYFTKRSICLDATNIIYDETDVRKISPNQYFSTININSTLRSSLLNHLDQAMHQKGTKTPSISTY